MSARWEYLRHTHDLTLPAWGPYSERYFGLSHRTDPRCGARFDLALFPGVYRRQLAIPDALRPSGYLPWEAAPDLSYYRYRQQIEWKDRLLADIAFATLSPDARLVRCELFNHTELPVDLALHMLARLQFPTARYARFESADALRWARPRIASRRGLVYDARHPGELDDETAVDGSAFLMRAGETARFVFPEPLAGKALFLRVRDVDGDGDGAWGWRELPGVAGGTVVFVASREEIVNGLAATDGGAPVVRLAPRDTAPEILRTDPPRGFLLRFASVPVVYGLRLYEAPQIVRRFAVDNLRDTFLYNDSIHQCHLEDYRQGAEKDHAAHFVRQPLFLRPGECRALHLAVVSGADVAVVERALADLPLPDEGDAWAAAFARGRAACPAFPEAHEHHFSQTRMAAVTATNVVYPARILDERVLHHTPGRQWQSLYTWDSGFIGLGLLEQDLTRAVENLNAYLTPPEDDDNAFVHHGTPLPVQAYLFAEIWKQTHDAELLAYFYPRLQHFYDYLAGHHPGSTTRDHCSEPLLYTWDYFYNSGGWDDYPPQWASGSGRNAKVVPVVSTAHAIRFAKILKRAALALGRPVERYDRDIARFADALRRHAWNPDSGYFSYVRVDADGRPQGPYLAPAGDDFNMGLDGASPLVAGVCTAEQRRLLWERMESEERLWTPIGLSTVDRSASYFRPDGYWNGSVWFPHQWFFWKAALTDGRGDFAWRIAKTALDLWERETRASLACYEHFCVQSGRGGGWHHFSGLSTPVSCWYGAYFRPGRLTTGFDAWPGPLVRDGRTVSCPLAIDGEPGGVTTILAVLDAERVDYAGASRPFRHRRPGVVEVALPNASEGLLVFHLSR